MPDYLSAPRLPKTIPATIGADYQFTVRLRTPGTNPGDPPGDPVDWPDDATVTIRIGVKPEPVIIAAVINGPDATVRIPSQILDQTRTGTLWQLIVTRTSLPLGDDPALNKPVLVGNFKRNDGATDE